MITRRATILTTATSVYDLINITQATWSGIFFQASDSNVDTVLFGDPSVQLHELRPRANGYLPVANSKSLFFVAPNVGNTVVFSLF